jgi:hypothetical protein
VDALTGTEGDDTFVGSDATYTTGDSVDGGAGTDELNLTLTGANTALVDLANVEEVYVRDTSGEDVNAAGWEGVEQVWNDRSTANLTVEGLAGLATVGVNKGDGSNYTVNFAASEVDLTGSSDEVAVALTSANAGDVTVEDGGSDGFETVNVSNTGESELDAIISTDLANVAVDGTGSLAITDIETSAGTDAAIGSLTSTGVALTIGGSNAPVQLAEGATVTGGSGDDALELALDGTTATGTITTSAGDDSVVLTNMSDGDDVSVDLGDGNDTLAADAIFDDATLTGGDGTDTLATTDNNAAGAVAADVANVSGFETLELTTILDADVDVSLFGVNNLTLAAGIDSNTTVSGLVSGASITYEDAASASGDVLTADVTDATKAGSNSDVLNVAISDDGTVDFGELAAAGVEDLNLSVEDTDPDATGSVFSYDVASATGALETLTVTGSSTSLDLSGTGLAATTEAVDATGYDGDFDVSIASGGANGVQIDTGEGGDSVTGGDAADVIDTGAGDDTIVGGAGADELTGGTGDDTFEFDLGGTLSEDNVITDFTVGDDTISGEGSDDFTDGITANDIANAGSVNTIEVDGSNVTVNNGVEIVTDASGSGNTADSLSATDVAAYLADVDGGGNGVVFDNTVATDELFFLVSDGTDSALFFADEDGGASTDAVVDADELTNVVTLQGVSDPTTITATELDGIS